MEPLKAQRKQTFEYDRPKVPDTVLLQIEKAKFKKADVKGFNEKQTVFSGYAKIIESVSFPQQNPDLGMPLGFGLNLVNGKSFKIEQFMGFLEAVKGEEVVVPHAQFFDDVHIWADLEQKLPNQIFAATIVENVYKEKDTGKVIENVQFEMFHTKAEYMELKNKAGVSGVSSPAAVGDAPALTPQAESPGGQKGFF